MLVLLFHNNDEILLRKYQKEFIRLNNCENSIFVPSHLLRINVHSILNQIISSDSDLMQCDKNGEPSKQMLKLFSKKMENLELACPRWNVERQTLECGVTLNFLHHAPKTVFLPLIKTLPGQKKIAENEISLPATLIFPKTIKTFRIGNQIDLDSNSSALTDYVWH